MNGLTLVIVNESEGYDRRRHIGFNAVSGLRASRRFLEWQGIVFRHAENQQREFGVEYDLKTLAETIVELDEYYAERAREDQAST